MPRTSSPSCDGDQAAIRSSRKMRLFRRRTADAELSGPESQDVVDSCGGEKKAEISKIDVLPSGAGRAGAFRALRGSCLSRGD